MSTYTCDPILGMTSSCDVNSRTTYYEYDDFSRLQLVKDRDWNVLKKICYGYSGIPEGCASLVNFANHADSGSYSKACTNDSISGPNVKYLVVAGKYHSYKRPIDICLSESKQWLGWLVQYKPSA